MLILQSFLYGLRFDICISSYILVIPFLTLSLDYFLNITWHKLLTISVIWIFTFYSIAFLICIADIPYFHHFFTRITTSIFVWNTTPLFGIKMILQEPMYWTYFIFFILVSTLFYFQLRKLTTRFKHTPPNQNHKRILTALSVFIVTGSLLFLGIRGRISAKTPIETGLAYFSNNAFANELGLNPVFTFMRSVMEDIKPENKRLTLMNDIDALKLVRNYLRLGTSNSNLISRTVSSIGSVKRMNVIVVIMEGMSRFNMGKYRGPNDITPNLDSLKHHSLWFENIYTQGIHTFNGIFSTLYSYPALLKQHPMNRIPSKEYYALPAILKENQYDNLFFITHDGQFDNTQGFLMANGFDKIYSEEDYPSEKILSTLGVPDDYIFEYSISTMNKINQEGKKFFCGFMTGSNHRPLIFPEWVTLKYKSKEEELKMVEYADWSIGKFIKLASAQSWYKNTIFVFVADHGMSYGHTYDMPLSFHHTPLIIHIPGDSTKVKSLTCMGGQIDIGPTILGLLNVSYINKTLGIDLLHDKRPYIYFTADDKIGCIDQQYYFIHRNTTGIETLYRYDSLRTDNYIEKYKSKADSMRNYAYSMLQATQYITEHEGFAKPAPSR